MDLGLETVEDLNVREMRLWMLGEAIGEITASQVRERGWSEVLKYWDCC